MLLQINMVTAQGLENCTPQVFLSVHEHPLIALNTTLIEDTVPNSGRELNDLSCFLSREQKSPKPANPGQANMHRLTHIDKPRVYQTN